MTLRRNLGTLAVMMQRVPEPELMEDLNQAEAYDRADFSAAHGRRIELFAERYRRELSGTTLDLGCGSGDILERFAAKYPEARFLGIDGSEPMLMLARRRMKKAGLAERMRFLQALIPSPAIPQQDYAAVMSHSLLHQLHKPEVLWDTVKQHARPGSFVFVADLRRPDSENKARQLVDELSANEPEVLRRDFYNSLLAAFRPEEIWRQLRDAGLPLTVEEIGDIHVLVYGEVKA
jgi:ubiquinone/menaquinone biosynthesis C-methylase UbiE